MLMSFSNLKFPKRLKFLFKCLPHTSQNAPGSILATLRPVNYFIVIRVIVQKHVPFIKNTEVMFSQVCYLHNCYFFYTRLSCYKFFVLGEYIISTYNNFLECLTIKLVISVPLNSFHIFFSPISFLCFTELLHWQ